MVSEVAENYTTIKLPKPFVKMIDEILDNEKLGYQSRAEVVKVAVREYYIRMTDKKLIDKPVIEK